MTAVMFASLLRVNPEITDWSGRKINLPLITGVSFADIFDIEAKGINDIVGNLKEVLDLLKKKNNQESKLTIILNAYGWNYDFVCTLKTTSGKPIKNAYIKCVSKHDPSKYYLVRGGVPSRDDGYVNMTNCYAGKNILRIYLETGDSVDYDIDIDWSKETNKTID